LWVTIAGLSLRIRLTSRGHKMSMFPPDWEVALSIDRLPEACPYSFDEMRDYLFRSHYHLCLNEEPTSFQVDGPRAQRQDLERRYWLFEARDVAEQRQWFVLIGTGKSLFDPSEKLRRWIWAETNDANLSSDEFLDKQYREQLEADARAVAG
jgi:hypothetical protein